MLQLARDGLITNPNANGFSKWESSWIFLGKIRFHTKCDYKRNLHPKKKDVTSFDFFGDRLSIARWYEMRRQEVRCQLVFRDTPETCYKFYTEEIASYVILLLRASGKKSVPWTWSSPTRIILNLWIFTFTESVNEKESCSKDIFFLWNVSFSRLFHEMRDAN